MASAPFIAVACSVRSVAVVEFVRSATMLTPCFPWITFLAALQPLTPVALSTHSSPIFFFFWVSTTYWAWAVATTVSIGRIRKRFLAPLGPFFTNCSPEDREKNGMPALLMLADTAMPCELAGKPMIALG